ncbi:aminodeoxychorismate synthase component I [Erythrobacter citreus]|uniref:Probable branched-chain-amino-acid aminotransferase n=1 Tax=Qipengyuania citrea TaxID=225971 RepID=A0A6I4UAW4_9SPHN|nr:aminodeoxychorismate synthase component I [Qipengyuania citrea]MDQ0566345.1 para-aminobenzoate synthetase/4-amino-4-deoxychorismate lyase [Qipengyuania citrea]MXP34704.1 aminodeoxychorismate synthase component I [Qipengyuania citrea]
MAERQPFVLLDDARETGAADALLFENPRRVFVAHRPEQVARALADADDARREGGELAGYIAYEAGLALEDRLADRAAVRSGGAGPLVWLGLFGEPVRIPADEMPHWLAARAPGGGSVGPLEPQLSPGGYAQAFAQLQEAIRAGDIYQANLTFPLAGGFSGDPLGLYAALRPAAQAGYGGVVFDGAHWLLSLSPELFVSLKDGEAKAKPMKGTRPRGEDSAADEALAGELTASVKDKAENLMIVDLMRNDLSRVAEAGSVRVDNPFAVESYPTVHQMVSVVRARLKPECGAADLVRALFPCGSITGAPKIRAMELIDAAERDPRGPYCGAIGRIGAGGDAAFNVAIRTLRLTEIENARGKAVLGVGGAIVADSEPRTEWREALLKGAFARTSSPAHQAAQFDLIETMRFVPETGIAMLETHLERLKASAGELGFSFDRHDARNQLHALCFVLEKPSRVRLLAARSGAIALEAQDMPAPWGDPARCIILPLPVDPGDWRLRHKSSDRGFYDEARRVAQAHDADEALFVREDGLLTEGSVTNIFVPSPDGVLLTPPARLGLLPGVFRRTLIEEGRARETEVRIEDLAGGFMLGNALRLMMDARLVGE